LYVLPFEDYPEQVLIASYRAGRERATIVEFGYTVGNMARPALIETPIPTLDEVVKDLGMSKARRDSIIRIMQPDDVPSFLTRVREKETSVNRNASTGRLAGKGHGGVGKTKKSA
jgi:hypothetical protein